MFPRLTWPLQQRDALSNMRFAVLLLVAVLTSCRAVPLHDIASSVPAGLTADRVGQAIAAAATRQRWLLEDRSPGHLIATLNVRGKHSATIAIDYDDRGYKISYRNSSNLLYDGTRIHNNYIGWISKLDGAIRSQLLRLQ